MGKVMFYSLHLGSVSLLTHGLDEEDGAAKPSSTHCLWCGNTSSVKNFRTVLRKMSWSSLKIDRTPMSIMFGAATVVGRYEAASSLLLEVGNLLSHYVSKQVLFYCSITYY